MSPEVVKLVTRCVIDYLGGRQEEFNRLVEKAMIINGQTICPECKAAMAYGRMGTKRNMRIVKVCTTCGYVEERKKGDESYAG